MTIDLSGKAVLVTGASRGIGRAIAQAMGEAGARVAVHYNNTPAPAEALAADLGNGAFAVRANLAEPDACDRLFERVVTETGRLDVLVNNAGVSVQIPMHADSATWFAGWQHTMMVNLMAAELLSRHAIAHFQAAGGGRIVNIASRAAFRGDQPDYMTYAASKAGLVALTKSIARGFGKEEIQAFVVAPGFTKTDMAAEFIETYGEDYVRDDIALNRLTEPADIAPLVVLLASGLADHATGTSIDVNAGSYAH